MTSTPTRLFTVVCLLLGVWIVTYWLWQPREPGVTFAAAAPGGVSDEATVHAAVVPPAPDPRTVPDDADAGRVRMLAPVFAEYLVQPGDTMERIAARVYGDARYATVILEANPFADPVRLIPGRTRLRLPEDIGNVSGLAVRESATGLVPVEPPAPEPPAAQVVEHVIGRRDTLWDISEAYYGKGHLWRRIYDANRDVIADPDRPPIGRTIRIPPME